MVSSVTNQGPTVDVAARAEGAAAADGPLHKEAKVTMSELMAMFAEILDLCNKLRNEKQKSKIKETVATADMAVKIAEEIKDNAWKEFSVSMAGSSLAMAGAGFSGAKKLKGWKLKDKHINPGGQTGPSAKKVSSMSAAERSEATMKLNEQKMQKMHTFDSMVNTGNSMFQHGSELLKGVHSSEIETERAHKEEKQKLDETIDNSIQTLIATSTRLHEILDKITQASAATNR